MVYIHKYKQICVSIYKKIWEYIYFYIYLIPSPVYNILNSFLYIDYANSHMIVKTMILYGK